jgi:hypothetical protein
MRARRLRPSPLPVALSPTKLDTRRRRAGSDLRTGNRKEHRTDERAPVADAVDGDLDLAITHHPIKSLLHPGDRDRLPPGERVVQTITVSPSTRSTRFSRPLTVRMLWPWRDRSRSAASAIVRTCRAISLRVTSLAVGRHNMLAGIAPFAARALNGTATRRRARCVVGDVPRPGSWPQQLPSVPGSRRYVPRSPQGAAPAARAPGADRCR